MEDDEVGSCTNKQPIAAVAVAAAATVLFKYFLYIFYPPYNIEKRGYIR